MAAKRPSSSLTQVAGSFDLRRALDAGQHVTVAPPDPAEIQKLYAYINSPAGRAWMNWLNTPAVANKPLVHFDPESTRQVVQALRRLPSTATKAKPRRRPPQNAAPAGQARPQAAPPRAMAPAARRAPASVALDEPEFIPEFTIVRGPVSRPARAAATSIIRPVTPGLTAQQTVMAGATGGTMLGAGLAAMFNAIRHVDQTGVGAVLFTLAGALAGAGAGTLIGARVVNPTSVTAPGLKVSLKPV